MSSSALHGIIGYTITPFSAGGLAPDLKALGTSIDRMIESGVHAIAPLGSTGEGAYLSDAEWEQVSEFSIKRVAGRVPTVVSVSDLTTAKAVQRARFAEAQGADVVMVLPASYWKLSDDEILAHYKAIGDSISVPIMLYNNPATSGIDMSVSLIMKIVKAVDNVTMVKESTGDIQRMHKLYQLSDGQIPFYNGSNPLALEALTAGAKGWCTAAPNLIPQLNLDLYAAVQNNDLEQARQLFYRQLPLLEFILKGGLPATIKAGLRLTGLDVGDPRLPVSPLNQAGCEQLLQTLKTLNVF
ncbi:dihydrodipicolinate synthase family protein [Candidatus Pantoea formicae]|uniref:dihydrodipicolinate synthase family protein n=1 Tax=Candidatus Pantoea formicae TaxID=2608355 RepID=UPI003EDAC78B